MAGERTKLRRLASTSLERALKLFEDSDFGIIVKETAREWVEQNIPRTAEDWTDEQALARLYGGQAKSWPVDLASDFGIGESTTRMALKNGTPVKVPLASVMPFLDLAALNAARVTRNGA